MSYFGVKHQTLKICKLSYSKSAFLLEKIDYLPQKCYHIQHNVIFRASSYWPQDNSYVSNFDSTNSFQDMMYVCFPCGLDAIFLVIFGCFFGYHTNTQKQRTVRHIKTNVNSVNHITTHKIHITNIISKLHVNINSISYIVINIFNYQ